MILVTGATGNVGSEVVKCLTGLGAKFKVATRKDFDFEKPETFLPALRGMERIFLVRPPAITDADRCFKPLVDAAKTAGVKQIVFLSLLGADKNRIVPHHKIENIIVSSGIPFTFLRSSFFMQNLSTTHSPDIREKSEIPVPAGNGKTSFIDVRDIAAVAAKTLTEQGHGNRAYSLTGDEALTYFEVAKSFSHVLGRRIIYRKPGVIKFAFKMKMRGYPWKFIIVMVGIYTVARLGLAATITKDMQSLLGRRAIRLEEFAHDYREAFNEIERETK